MKQKNDVWLTVGGELARMLDNGFCIERSVCRCGGNWAWYKSGKPGYAHRVGCVCHETGKAVEKFNEEKDK